MKEVREGIQLVRHGLSSEMSGSEKYWFSADRQSDLSPGGTFLLPAYDEFLISYRDRSASLPAEKHKKTISSNGIFWPVVVSDGQVIGLWKRKVLKDAILIEAGLYRKPTASIAKKVEKAAHAYGKFMGMDVRIDVNTL